MRIYFVVQIQIKQRVFDVIDARSGARRESNVLIKKLIYVHNNYDNKMLSLPFLSPKKMNRLMQ